MIDKTFKKERDPYVVANATPLDDSATGTFWADAKISRDEWLRDPHGRFASSG